MLRKLLFKSQDRKQLIIAMIGAFLGIIFLVASIHYLIRVNEFGAGAEIIGPNTIIVQKQVTTETTAGMTSTDFTMEEIEELRKYDFVKDVQPVISNNFKIWFETKDDLVPEFKTDAFVQTVSKEFLDVESDKWHWKEGDPYLPVILPRDLLVMLNTFMSAQDIPPVSEELVMQVNSIFRISQGKNAENIKVRIIGFTNEVSSMLVPKSFIDYGNEKYAKGEKTTITQVMISSNENQFGLLENILDDKGLESKKGQVALARLKSIIGTLIWVLLCISIIAVFTSGLVLIQYMQLLITRNDYEVRTLMRIGYHPKIIINHFFKYFVIIFSIISLGAVAVFIPFKMMLDSKLATGGLYIDNNFTLYSFLALVLAFLIFALSSKLTAKKGILREF